MPKLILSLTYTLADITEAAAEFWKIAGRYHMLAFSGELGAGKTTFIHALCEKLGVIDNVSSPTFALINEYHFLNGDQKEKTIYHMDWYRLKSEEEAINAGMEDSLLQPGAYCFIEWPEKAVELMRRPYLWISIKNISSTQRNMQVELYE